MPGPRERLLAKVEVVLTAFGFLSLSCSFPLFVSFLLLSCHSIFVKTKNIWIKS